jgi:hypothetical protein
MDSTTKSVIKNDMFEVQDETNWTENGIVVELPPTTAGE